MLNNFDFHNKEWLFSHCHFKKKILKTCDICFIEEKKNDSKHSFVSNVFCNSILNLNESMPALLKYGTQNKNKNIDK